MATFGYTSVGGSGTGNLTESTMRASRPWSPAFNGTVRSITVYTEETNALGATYHIRPVLYTEAGALVTYGAEVAESGTLKWITLPITPATITAGVNYKIGVWFGPERIRLVYDADVNYDLERDTETYHATNAPSSTWSTASITADRSYSIYATYTINYSFDATVAAFVLAGQGAILTATRLLNAAVQTFALTGQNIILTAQRLMNTSVGQFVLTGIDALFAKGYGMSVSVGEFVLSGASALFSFGGWRPQSKNNSTYGDQPKNASVYTTQSKSASSYGSQTKNTVTYASPTRNTSVDNYQAKS